MRNPEFYLMLHGMDLDYKSGSRKKREELDPEQEKIIDAYLDQLPIDEGPPNQLISPQMKRNSLKLEVREIFEMKEYRERSKLAVDCILTEGMRYLDKEPWDQLQAEFETFSNHINSLNLSDLDDKNFSEIHAFSDASLGAIAHIAMAKFDEKQYKVSLALFTFLILLEPENGEWWFRAGIAAQFAEEYALASKNYLVAHEMSTDDVTSCLFAAHCFYKAGQKDQAKDALELAKKLIENNTGDQEKIELYSQIEKEVAQ